MKVKIYTELSAVVDRGTQCPERGFQPQIFERKGHHVIKYPEVYGKKIENEIEQDLNLKYQKIRLKKHLSILLET